MTPVFVLMRFFLLFKMNNLYLIKFLCRVKSLMFVLLKIVDVIHAVTLVQDLVRDQYHLNVHVHHQHIHQRVHVHILIHVVDHARQ